MEDKVLFGFENELVIHDSVNVGKSNKRWTKEGFLICDNVVFAHVGSRKYHRDELGVKDDNEYITVKRTEDDLFSEENISSIIGKSVTFGHPKEIVDSANWKKHEYGTVLDAYREGDKLKGQIIIKDKKLAKDVDDGKIKALSLGYKAKVVKVVDGTYQFKGSTNNHVAIVSKGRDSEAFILDAQLYDIDGEGGDTMEHQNETPETNKDIVVKDDVAKTQREINTITETEYDYDTGEEVVKTITTEKYRRKVEKNAVVGDEQVDNKEIVKEETKETNEEVIKDTKEKIKEKENQTNMKTVLDYMKEYKEVFDTFPESEAKALELQRIDDECKKAHNVSVVPTKVVKDSALNNITVKPTTVVNDEGEKEVILDGELNIGVLDKEMYISDFYESLNPMNKSFNKSHKDGMERLTMLGQTKGEDLLRKIRKVGL